MMNTFKTHLQTWQKDSEGIPVFRSTNDAEAYAHLIVDNEFECERMKIYMKSVYDELDAARAKSQISLQGLLIMACRCQLFREFVEEIQTIKDERLKTF